MLIDTHCHLTYDFSSGGGADAVMARGCGGGGVYDMPDGGPGGYLAGGKVGTRIR